MESSKNITKVSIINEINELVKLTNTLPNNGMYSFASIKNYSAKGSGEVANHNINLNFAYYAAKQKDFAKLKNSNITYADFLVKFNASLDSKIDYLTKNGAQTKTIAHFVNLRSKISEDIFKKAYEVVYNSLQDVGGANLDGTIKQQSSQSKAQNEAYIVFNNAIKFNINTGLLYFYARTESKKVLTKGELNETASRILTFAQDVLKKGMNVTKYRYYIIERAEITNLLKSVYTAQIDE